MAKGTYSKTNTNLIDNTQQKLSDVLSNSHDEIRNLSKEELVSLVLPLKGLSCLMYTAVSRKKALSP